MQAQRASCRMSSSLRAKRARSAGGTNSDEGVSIAVDRAANSYVTGYFKNDAAFDAITVSSSGNGNVFIAKFDPAGRALWVRRADADVGYGIALDSRTNVCVTGSYASAATFEDITLPNRGGPDIFVAKYDRGGHLLWVRHEGGNGPDDGESVSVDANDNIYVAGLYLGLASFGTNVFNSPGHADVVTIKYDPTGEVKWALHAGGTAYKAAYGLAVHPQGVLFATGFFRGATMFGDFMLTNHFIPPNTAPSQRDVFVMRVDGPPDPPLPPRLEIGLEDGHVLLSWPASASGFQLESTPWLRPGSAWSPVAAAPVQSADRNLVTNGILPTNRFYRLRKP